MNPIGRKAIFAVALAWTAFFCSIAVCGCAGAAGDDEDIDSLGRPIVNPGGVCWSDDGFGGPGCQPNPSPPNECALGSACNTSPISNCAGRCNYGYVCTGNCTGTPKTWASSHHSSCSDPAYLPTAADGKFYHPGPDLRCGTSDDPANCSDGKNPGRDGLCDDGSHPDWNTDNYP